MRTLRPLYHLLRADPMACSYLPGRDAYGGQGLIGYVRRPYTTAGA